MGPLSVAALILGAVAPLAIVTAIILALAWELFKLLLALVPTTKHLKRKDDDAR